METGTFSYKTFYLRRLRRLAPAYLIVSFSCLIAGIFILLPQSFIYNSKLAGLAFLSLSNFYLANTAGGYFETQVEEIPLLHTWSLSVEVQFYLLWPVLLLVLFRVFKGRLNTAFLVALFVATFLFSIWYTQTRPISAYYLLFPRFYELLTGGILAIVMSRLPQLQSSAVELLSMLGLTLIIGSALLFNNSTVFPGYNALIPRVGTALLIYSGMFNGWVTRILETGVMVNLGKISYSLYLWHWPIFAFTRYATGGLSPEQAVAGIIVSILLSYLSWKYVEQPFRGKYKFTPKTAFRYMYLVPACLFIVIVLVINKGDGFINRFGEKSTAVAAMESIPDSIHINCQSIVSQGYCGDILLVGDSHADHFTDFVNTLAQSAQLRLNTKTYRGCPPLLGLTPMHIKDGHLQRGDDCRLRNERLFDDAEHYRYVVLAGYWSIADNRDDHFFINDEYSALNRKTSLRVIKESLYATVQRIVESGAIPVIIKDNPLLTKQIFRCLRRNLLPYYEQTCLTARDAIIKQQHNVEDIFSSLANAYPSLLFIDPKDVMCNDDFCLTEYAGIPVYRDENHLNGIGSRTLGDGYRLVVGNPFKRN